MMWFKNPQPSRGGWKRFVIGTQTFPHEALSLDIDGDGHKEYWVGDASHDRSGGFGRRNGGIVYFRMTGDPTKPWTKIRVAAAPEVGRQCRAVDVDGDGDLDVVSTADHFQDKHTISVVWWENKTPQVKPKDKSAQGHAEAAREEKSARTVIFADNFDRQPEGWTNAKGKGATDMLHGEQFGNWETVHIAKGHAEISASHRHGKTGKGFRFKVVKSSGVTKGCDLLAYDRGHYQRLYYGYWYKIYRITDTKWHRYVWEFVAESREDGQANDGVVRFWVDQKLIFENTKVDWVADKPTRFTVPNVTMQGNLSGHYNGPDLRLT